MSCAALVSCLGVAGWGPLHWWLRRDGEPEALLARLRRAWWLAEASGAADPQAALLLASLVRSSGDLTPLAAVPHPSLPDGPLFRHRLVCRPGHRWLQLRSWECRSAALPWRCCGRERCLDPLLLSPRGGPHPRWSPARAWRQDPSRCADAFGASERRL